MASHPSEGATPVDRVNAFIVAFGPGGSGGFSPGRIDIAISNGSCVLSAGRRWVVLTPAELAELTGVLARASTLLAARTDEEHDDPLAAHARRMVEGLGLEWPAP